ncbi:MAG TPA: phenylalanine--tRNA ligase subunit beta [Bacillota bacterium]|nr:phenylalanine--tRNA ligase subunit beta [Bacillota bacterium]
MLVSINWLKDYVDIGTDSIEQLAEKITKSGIEVDGIHTVIAEESTNVVTGYVKSCEKHPDADKLNICQVDVGEEELLQIICGAPNVAQGQKVVVAKPGAVLPNNFKIKKVKLRGIESNGMICSLQELSVDEAYVPEQYKEGIVVLPEDTNVGESVSALLNLDDTILEFDLTPNRADALSMIGVAYEVAAILDKEVNLPHPEVETSEEDVADYVSVSSEDPDLCPYYGAFIVKDVDIKPSPLWMQNALLAAGVRPINNVVDITNYVLMEYGQPLHAFDYDLLDSKEIVVRRAKEGEEIVTLDDKTRKLTNDNLLITNGKEGIALAGVMGGAHTEVNDGTKNVLIEAAYFDPQTVRQAVNQTGLRSDASTRFEKGVDKARVREAGLRACELLVKYANGKLVDEAAEFNEMTIEEKVITVNADDINKRIGTDISAADMGDIFRRLRFGYEVSGNDLTLRIPTRRNDISIFEDIVEEVARIYGYDHLPYTLPANASQPGGLSERQLIKRNVQNFMESVGFTETVSYSLTNDKDINKLLSPDVRALDLHPVQLNMPISEDHKYLRLSLLPELLNILNYNGARNVKNLAVYEIGSVFLSEEERVTKQPNEQLRLSAAVTGMWQENKWQGENKKVDFFVLKGVLESLFAYLKLNVQFTQVVLDDMHPGRCALLTIDNETIGFIGQVHPTLAKSKDLSDTYVFDINFDHLLHVINREPSFNKIPKYPSMTRDVALIVDREIASGDIRQAIKRMGEPLVKNVEVFDVYEGEHLADGKKSIAYTMSFQDLERTLKDEEVTALFEEIVEKIEKQFNASIRSS